MHCDRPAPFAGGLLVSIALIAMLFAASPRALAQDASEATTPPDASADASEIAAPEADGQQETVEEPPQALEPVQEPPRFRVEPWTDADRTFGFDPLGSLEIDGDDKLFIEFSSTGAGVDSIRLADELISVDDDRAARDGEDVPAERHVQIQHTQLLERVGADGTILSREVIVPFSAYRLRVEGEREVFLVGVRAWRQTETPGEFEARIVDTENDNAPAFRIFRKFELESGAHEIRITQRVESLLDEPVRVALDSIGPVDMPEDQLNYGGDKRRLRFGYLPGPAADPTQMFVAASDYLKPRHTAFGDSIDERRNYAASAEVWPNENSREKQHSLVWFGVTNRYFGVLAHELVDPATLTTAGSKAFDNLVSVQRLLINNTRQRSGLFGTSWANNAQIGLLLEMRQLEVAPGGSVSFDFGVYAGPKSKPIIRQSDLAAQLGIEEVVLYNFGGPCAFCTFEWLTGPLLGLLRIFHSLVSDWAIAIVLLVVCVRTILHPVTRWAQVRMQIFGKRMQIAQPKLARLKEKYKDDPKKMQEETLRVMRTEGANPAGCIGGMIPMLMQSPVWIALYATLYFVIDLRHEAAFFGVFQNIGGWDFLADLSEPDRAIYFGRSIIEIPLMGAISSFNILPLILGVVFFLQQKYLTPPQTATLTPEQESQQKIMKFMMVVMFPIFMYNAPSGLALYFITNSTLGILESRWIRGGLEKSGRLDEENLRPKPPKPGGFMSKLQEMAQRQQDLKAMREAQANMPKPGERQTSQRKGQQQARRYKKR
ncbi:MAG: membrane protein insertase YidC [Planctomycetota bacterium]